MKVTIIDLAGAIYSSGKVFDGLSAGRLDTENFLRSGSLAGISSRADLALLVDLRDVAQFIIDHHDQPIDASYVYAINAQITRSGALHPGALRTNDQQIGVQTRYGRHTPPRPPDSPSHSRATDPRSRTLPSGECGIVLSLLPQNRSRTQTRLRCAGLEVLDWPREAATVTDAPPSAR
jgi:hypothetical protein